MSGIPLTSMKILPGIEGPIGLPSAPGIQPAGAGFADMLGKFIGEVDGLGAESGMAKEMFLNGEQIDLHEVMIKAEEAGIAMDLLLEIRNKLVEAYQEVIRMPL